MIPTHTPFNILKKLNSYFVLTPLAVAGLHSQAHAAVIPSYHLDEPDTNIIASFAPGGGNPENVGWVNEPSLIRNIGQTFSVATGGASAYAATHLTISVTRPSTAPALSSFSISFYELDSVSDHPADPLKRIITQQGNVSIETDNTPTFLTFQLDTPVILTAGKSYSFVLELDDPQSPQRFLVSYNAYNPSVGLGWYTPDEQWTAVGATFNFYIQGEAIPEASTLVMLPAGALLLGFAFRRRKTLSEQA